MINERQAFAVHFRDLSERFNGLSENWDGLRKWKACEEAGTLVMEAYRRGYLALPGLAKLVDWVENPPPDPEIIPGRQTPCVKVACAGNLFVDVCGYNQVPVRFLGIPGIAIVCGHIDLTASRIKWWTNWWRDTLIACDDDAAVI
jgi:hypothetical protein